MIDCTQIISTAAGNTDISAGLLPACIQGQAAIEAGHFSGWMTLFAGMLALCAGGLAFLASYVGAKVQVDLQKKVYEAKVAAYRFRMEHLARRLASSFHQDKDMLSRPHAGLANLLRTEQGQPGRTLIPDEFSPLRWEEHSILGLSCVSALVEAYDSATLYNRLKGEVLSRQTLQGRDENQLAEELDDLLASVKEGESKFTEFLEELEVEPKETGYEVAFRVVSRSLMKNVIETALFR